VNQRGLATLSVICELRRGGVRDGVGNVTTGAQLGERDGRQGRGRRGGALDEAARLGTRWCGREKSPKRGGARRGDGGGQCGALQG